MSDYLTRADDLQLDLDEVGESVSDGMFTAMVLKGLPREFDNIVTVLNYGEKKPFNGMRRDLIKFFNSMSKRE